MSLFEHYPQELHDLEAQIRNYIAICGLDPRDSVSLDTIIHDHSACGAKGTLRALLILRIKVETGMMGAGMSPQ
ncbi:MAG: hypothetical protein RIR18_1161 [Pseudomonadota bacterium]|jgi:hypothetical protein